MRISQRIYDAAIPLLGIYPKEIKIYAHKVTSTKNIYYVLIHNAPNWKQSKSPYIENLLRIYQQHGDIYTIEYYSEEEKKNY